MTNTIDLSVRVAGVHLPFAAMNGAGTAASGVDLQKLVASRTGAVVLQTATVHPFVHPEFRSLHNPGFDKLIPLVRELRSLSDKPIIASIAGVTADELVTLGRAFTDAGAALLQVDTADGYVQSVRAPFDELGQLGELIGPLQAADVAPVAVKIPERVRVGIRALVSELAVLGVRAVVVKNDFAGFEKFMLEAGTGFDIVVYGEIRSGYDIRRALAKGACAVQVTTPFLREGPGIFARLEREMSAAIHG